MRWLFKTNFRSFYLLNATQFLGALNDNIFKLLVIYLLINVKGAAAANTILSLAGAIFVIPFLVFSSGAGILADRISKRTIIVYTKIFELGIMVFGLVAVLLKWEIGAYTALFLMAAQSALFGPSKYGIIPELVDPKMVSKANGSMASFTYLAIILGTFLASFIVDITNKNFAIESLFCIFIAIIGLLTSLGITKTEPQNSPKKINPIFIWEIYQTLKFSWKVPHLLTAMLGSSFFLFIGAFAQLNIIPFAMQSLDLSEVGGGYLFLATALGIAIGALIAGQLSKERVEPGLSCISGFFIAFFLFGLYFCASSLWLTILWLTLLGMVGGTFLIPFDSFIQVNSPDEKRGQVIAATNFLSFLGVLLAAFALYLFSEELGLSASSGFFIVGWITLFVSLVMAGRLSSFLFPFLGRKVLKRIRKLHLETPPPASPAIYILQSRSNFDPLLIFSCITQLKLVIPTKKTKLISFINRWVDSLFLVPEVPDTETQNEIQQLLENGNSICFFIKPGISNDIIRETYTQMFSKSRFSLYEVHGTKERISKKLFFIPWTSKIISMRFTAR